MSKPTLEQTIKEYFDQYGAILVGMHQDLQAQQVTVDRKLAETEGRLESSIRNFDQRSDDVVARISASAENFAIGKREEELAHELRAGSLDTQARAAVQRASDEFERVQQLIGALLDDTDERLALSIQDFRQGAEKVATRIGISSDLLAATVCEEKAAHEERIYSLDVQVKTAVLSADEQVKRLREDIKHFLEGFSTELTVTKQEIKKFLADTSKSFSDHVDLSRNTLAGEIEKALIKLRESVVRHERLVSTALDEYRSTNIAQRTWFEAHSARVTALSKETNSRLQIIDEKVAAHQLRETAFNRRLRQIIIGIIVCSAIGVLATVALWKP